MTRRTARLRGCLATCVLASTVAVVAHAQTDPMLDGDFLDPATGSLALLQPSVPWITAGSDGELGTADDVVDFAVVGDVDIVVRGGINAISGAIPDTSPLRGTGIPTGTVGGFGTGVPIPFIVIASDGSSPGAGSPVAPASLEGAPVLVMAFADLDDDGWVGITNLDGDPNDHELEEAELDPIGRRFAFFQAGQAVGELYLGMGGPAAGELRIVLAAAAFTGQRNPDFFGGEVPEGPVVLTRLPFFPRTDPDQIVEGNIPEPASEDGLVGVEVSDEFTPDPNQAYGEAFTLPTDGSAPSIDVAVVRSGSFVSFGLARVPDPALYDPDTGGALGPGLEAAASLLQGGTNRVLLEAVDGFGIGAGSGNHTTLRVVPLDQRGNVAEPPLFRVALLIASQGVAITSPDEDQDPLRESLRIGSAAGAPIELSGTGTLLVETVPEPACGRGWSLAVIATLAFARRPRLIRR